MERAKRFFTVVFLTAIILASALVVGCGHTPYSPCNSFLGGPCGPEIPINQ